MSIDKGFYTRQEILSQPEAWTAALDVLGTQRQAILDSARPVHFDQIIFTGCGSTYYLALAAASLTQELTGRSCRAFPASELWLYPRSSFTDGKTLLVAVSRSGETTETLQACQAFLSDRRGDSIDALLLRRNAAGKTGYAQPGLSIRAGALGGADTRLFHALPGDGCPGLPVGRPAGPVRLARPAAGGGMSSS